MLLRDKKTGRLKKQPAKIGDMVVMFQQHGGDGTGGIDLGFT